MSIISFGFYAALLLLIVIYYIVPKKAQWVVLLAASLGFLYMASGLAMLGAMCAEALVFFGGARLMGKTRHKRLLTSVTVLLAFLVLFYFKDMSFITTLQQTAAFITGKEMNYSTFQILAPLGVSYYTLSLVGYILDVYWEKYQAEKNPLRVILFAGYFPVLTSGPMVRYDEMSVQFRSPHKFDLDKVARGGERILLGCFKKLVIADRANIFIQGTMNSEIAPNGITQILAILMFALRLYTDFDGCMDIILGVSECFGVFLPENFKTPFASRSLSEFWRRWHITMGVWFKEYLLYPLLKSRVFQRINKFMRSKFGKTYGKKLATCLGLSVVWLSIGLWHGGTAAFILASGIIPGFLIICGELLEPVFKWLNLKLRINTKCFSFRLFQRLRVLATMCFAWVFICADSVSGGINLLRNIRTNIFNPWVFSDGTLLTYGLDIYDFGILALSLIFLIIVGVWHERGISIRDSFAKQNIVFRWAVLFAAIFVVVIFGVYGPGYNAAGFIYGNF